MRPSLRQLIRVQFLRGGLPVSDQVFTFVDRYAGVLSQRGGRAGNETAVAIKLTETAYY